MAIYLKDIVANPQILKQQRGMQQKCCKCETVLHEVLTGKRKTADGYACSDCFYELLGVEIEANPIASAGVRRG